MSKQTDMAYMAGLVDGEGSIGIMMTPRSQAITQLTIKMCCEDTIEWVAQTFGGNIEHIASKVEGHSDCWRWRANGARAAEILVAIEPYMVTKRYRACLFIEFVGDTRGQGKRPSPALKQRRVEILEEYDYLRQRQPTQ